jgi:hypothetical protein
MRRSPPTSEPNELCSDALHLLLVGHELDHGATELDLGAVADRRAHDSQARDLDAVRRVVVGDDDLVTDALHLEVLARHRRIGEHEAARAIGADRQRLVAELDLHAAIGALDHEEQPAAHLARMRRAVVEHSGDDRPLPAHGRYRA